MPTVEEAASRLGVGTHIACDADGKPTLDEDESVTSTCPAVSFVLADDIDAGKGTLYITTRRVVWTSTSQPGLSLELRYPKIVMHAVSRDATAFSRPCIYLQLDDGSEDMGAGEEEDEEDLTAEARLIPEDASALDDMFKSLCDCAAMNPDSDMEEPGEGEFFFNEEEVFNGLDEATRAAVLAQRMDAAHVGEEEEHGNGEHVEEVLGDDDGRFEDGDEDGTADAPAQ